MARGQSNFTAQVGAWVAETQERMDAVFRESAQEVISVMQTPVGAGGNMPVDTGFLRSSLMVGINTPPVAATRENPSPEGTFTYAASLAIAGAKIGDTISAAYSAKYAPNVEYGGGKRVPRRFVALAAAQWPSIVSATAERLKASVTGP